MLLFVPFSFQLYAKLQCIKAEIKDVNDEHVRSRQELEQTQNELTRELKFKWVQQAPQNGVKLFNKSGIL